MARANDESMPQSSLGAHRLPPAPEASRAERLWRSREMLYHALNQGTTVAVVGSGCSIPLGYPSWKSFAAELIEQTLASLGSQGGQREYLRRFQDRLSSAERPDSRELMYSIGVCKRLLGGGSGKDDLYRQYLEKRFRLPDPPVDVPYNPHRALLKLPIHRFVTTNYDGELERALEKEREIEWEAFGIGASGAGPGRAARPEPPLSFTQRPTNCDQLALFALARIGAAKNRVFHCHGRYDDLDSIIATELDYQQWYLAGEAGASPTFLETLDLLFNSHPILFVGFSLGDEDLLRPLRRIGAASPERRPFRPLFALLPEAAEGEEWEHDRLFERYGLHVLPYTAPATSDPKVWGETLCAELARLEEERLEWRDRWLEKPLLRSVTVQAKPPQPYWHYRVAPGTHEILGREQVEKKVKELAGLALPESLEDGSIPDPARVIALVGPGGTGKSWHAMRLLEKLEEMNRESEKFDGFFFWSSYYADDSITGLDRLLGYIDSQGNRPASRLQRIPQCLRKKEEYKNRYLIVLDGIERLLHPTENPEVGRSNDPATRKLLEILAAPDSNSTVVLTSRLWPKELDELVPVDSRKTLERMRTKDLIDVEPFKRFDRAEVSALCSLLEGHTYALFLAAQFLGDAADEAERRKKLRRVLSSTDPDRRLAKMIELAVGALDGETPGLTLALLQRLAVFMSPVTEKTVQLCFDLAVEERISQGKATTVELPRVKNGLLAGGLLFKVAAGPTESEPAAFTVHPTVRSYVFQQDQRIERDVPPNFTLAGFTSGRAAVHPGSPATAALVRQLFDRLYAEATAELQAGREAVASQLCRSLFGIMRSRMETNTAPRWTTYHDYIRFGLRLVDLAKRLSPRLWSFREPQELKEVEDVKAPLYADEVAFLYNDVGLTLCAEGYMQDTLAVWEQGYEINRIMEGEAEVPLYSLQSQLHLGHTFLELGNLPIAAQYLEETARTNRKVGDPDYGGRILGYRALVSYYRGQFEEADRLYTKAFREIKKAGGNPRAQSFFLTHRAKLALVQDRYDKAEEYLRSSRALAASGQAVDLLAYVRTAYGGLYRQKGSWVDANAELHAALAEARRLGIRRLETEVLNGLSRLALNLGDAALARTRALAALGIANELGLGLRQTQSLLVLGMATVQVGQPRLGAAYLRLAKRLGDEQEYWLASHDAERELQALGAESG